NGTRRNIIDDHRAGSDNGAPANVDGLQHLGPAAQPHIILNLDVALTAQALLRNRPGRIVIAMLVREKTGAWPHHHAPPQTDAAQKSVQIYVRLDVRVVANDDLPAQRRLDNRAAVEMHPVTQHNAAVVAGVAVKRDVVIDEDT